jgi:SIT4-associating protein SAP185/190
VDGINFDKEITTSSPAVVNTAPEDNTCEQSAVEAIELEIDRRSLESLEVAAAEFQSKSEIDDDQRELASNLQIPLSPELHDGGLSPHPEDKPAPLFAKKSEEPSQLTQSDNKAFPVFEESSGDTTDTTMAEAGDGSNSVLMGNTEDYSTVDPVSEPQAAPVVGDFLKMQFVKHKVVPTILVSSFNE